MTGDDLPICTHCGTEINVLRGQLGDANSYIEKLKDRIASLGGTWKDIGDNRKSRRAGGWRRVPGCEYLTGGAP